MPSKRVNVLVYAGNGSTLASVRHAVWSLRRLLGSNYAVITVTADQILKEPWMASCVLLVMPGGADLDYCRSLNGAGNRLIKQYVQMGGVYLGFCAGGYYGSASCEFEIGQQSMEVVGPRELAFFPGICRGLAFPGFQYHSEAGARAAQLQVNAGALSGESVQNFRAYYNGGGVFVDASSFAQRGIEILASYTEDLAVEAGDGRAAVVYCRVGEGKAILTGPHPEFSAHNLAIQEGTTPAGYDKVIEALAEDEAQRISFMKACLRKLDLVVSANDQIVPNLSELHLSSSVPGQAVSLVAALREARVVVTEASQSLIKGENDTFRLYENDAKDRNASPSVDQPGIVDYNAVPKTIIVHEQQPNVKETTEFNHGVYYAYLHQRHQKLRTAASFGSILLYGEVMTSTSTILEKNTTLLSHLPAGFTAVATTQVAGRGRGSNVWVSPAGSLMFSTVMRHSMALSSTAPVVFVQYLAAMAIVAGIHDYDRGYNKLQVRLKWPNDIYALDTTSPDKTYVKIGGILVNSSYAGGDYTLVTGIGINVNNSAPTTSLTKLARALGLPAMSLERLLASILAHFEALYIGFCYTGFNDQLMSQYLATWLHTDQIVTLETENGARARIKGITRDWGLLIAEELGWEDRPTGRKFELQSDSNSFDFFKGLLRKKL